MSLEEGAKRSDAGPPFLAFCFLKLLLRRTIPGADQREAAQTSHRRRFWFSFHRKDFCFCSDLSRMPGADQREA